MGRAVSGEAREILAADDAVAREAVDVDGEFRVGQGALQAGAELEGVRVGVKTHGVESGGYGGSEAEDAELGRGGLGHFWEEKGRGQEMVWW